MKTKFLFAMAGFLMISGLAAAEDATPCRYLSATGLRAAAVGFRCVTTKGVVFQLVTRNKNRKEVWLDTQSGLLWSDALDSRKISQYDAVKICSLPVSQDARGDLTQVAWRLPSGNPKNADEDFTAAQTHGFQEVLPNLDDRIFWSTSVDRGYKDSYVNSPYYHVYNGYSDYLGSLNRDGYNDGQSVRCVGH